MKAKALILAAAAAAGILAGCRATQAPEAQVRDAEITAEVRRGLASELGLQTMTNVDVNTTNGVVTLAGEVRTPSDRELAEVIARRVPDVRSVNNNLQVAAADRAAP